MTKLSLPPPTQQMETEEIGQRTITVPWYRLFSNMATEVNDLTVLDADQTYYVATTGNDNNNGSQAAPFLTLQHAYRVAAFANNSEGYRITISVAAGTYNEDIYLFNPFTSYDGGISFIGDQTTPSNVVIDGDIYCDGGGPYGIQLVGFKFQNTSPGSIPHCIEVDGGWLVLGDVEFGSCTGSHIQLHNSATLYTGGSITVSGGAQYHWELRSNSFLRCRGATYTFTGSPAFTSAFFYCRESRAEVDGLTYSGTVTGKRFEFHGMGDAYTNSDSSTYFPGSTNGQFFSGGYGTQIGAQGFVLDDNYCDLSWTPSGSPQDQYTGRIEFGANDGFYLEMKDDGSSGSRLYLYGNSASPAANDRCAIIEFDGNNNGGSFRSYGVIQAKIDDPVAGSEDSHLEFATLTNNTSITNLSLGTTFTTDASGSRYASVFDVGNNSLGCLVVENNSGGNGPGIITYAASASPAANDIVGYIDFIGKDSADNEEFYGVIHSVILDTTDGSEDSQMSFGTMDAGTLRTKLTLGGTGTYSEYSHILAFDGNNAPTLQLQNTSAGTGGPGINFLHDTSSPAAGDIPMAINVRSRDSAGNGQDWGFHWLEVIDTTNTSEDAKWIWQTVAAGTMATRLTIAAGIQVGAPTGGDKGAGTANFAGDIYKNNTAYTNPDYALEHYFTGEIVEFADNEGAEDYSGIVPLDKLEAKLRSELRLPGITDDPMGAFARSEILLEKLEEAYCYIIELHKRVAALEGN